MFLIDFEYNHGKKNEIEKQQLTLGFANNNGVDQPASSIRTD